MKLAILLILLIGSVMSSNTMTSATANMWTLTYLDVSSTAIIYNFTLSYSEGATANADIVTAANNMGLICIITTLNFTLADDATATNAAFSFSSGATTAAGDNEILTNWDALTAQTHPSMIHTTDTSLATGASTANCPLTTVANTPTFASYVVSWANSLPALCTNWPIKGATWYARCFHMDDQTKNIASTSSVTGVVVSGVKNVTIGASTFATGATILAGIAYLQF
jgi:hypothetical protein